MSARGCAATRPIMRYHGGKWRIAPWIIKHLPPHRIYVEPFGGAASVLMRKPRVHAEVYNDLDGDIVNVFRVLRDPPQAEELRERLSLTPFARAEFELSYEDAEDPVEKARRTLIRSMMGFGTSGVRGRRTGFRARTYVRNVTGGQDWARYPDCIPAFCERLQGVTIEQRDGIDLISLHDGPNTLFYLDPPYLHETRSSLKGRIYADGSAAYAHELSDADHDRLLGMLQELSGMVVLSGYPSSLYIDRLAGWHCIERDSLADGGQVRRECLWLNSAAERALHFSPCGLFSEGAP